jgi:chaperone required for assembly of F1-ATPase
MAMRRFWREVAPVALAEGFAVHLDGRPLLLPEGGALSLPNAALAAAVAEEWRRLGPEFSYDAVPLTRIVGTATMRIAPAPEASIAALARYGESDLLCYRARAPEALAQRQRAHWQPWLDWAARVLDAPLAVTDGVMPCPQPPASLAALRAALAAQGPIGLAALGILVPVLGSLVLGLAVAAGALDGAAALALAELDALFQEEIWGRDAAQTARRDRVAGEIAAAARILALTRHTEGMPS